MNPERRQQIDDLFHAALACEPGRRSEFLASRCARDETLRREVELLLASHHGESGADEPQATRFANAYQAYQLARHHFNVSFPDLTKSRDCLEEAVRLDPDFAPAHAALAEQWLMETITGLQSPAEAFPKVKEGIRRAKELNLESAEFYAAAGFTDLLCDWNFSGAEKHLRRAIELSPHYAFAYKYLGEVLMFQGRANDAEKSLRRAAEIAPMNLHVGVILSISYFLARDYQKVIQESERLFSIYPRFVVANIYRCLAWEQMGRALEAVREYERMLGEPGGEIARRFMGYAYASTGNREMAIQSVAKLDAESRAHYLSPTHQAVICAALNEPEQAFSYLEKALLEKDPWVVWSGTDPRLDNLRSDPRFNELLRTIGLKTLDVFQPASTRMAKSSTRDRISRERWQEIDRLFHEALEREPSQRQSFLIDACHGDEPLRLETESLIAAHNETEGFIEIPPGDVAAEMLGTYERGFEPGREISSYRIVRQLGSGGMGEVYLAEDIRLKRHVALKLLPAHFTINPDRVRRFEREARAASVLNHPNIVTLYEIGKSNTTHFIATEFVDGKTLRQLMKERPFTLNETLNVSMQVAEALSGAHAAGIVHRDIKPENIMIRRDGYVKILDFGLAKLTEQQTTDSDLETPTLLQSNPGLIMGTVQYMSPEQARAKNVGVGTDIWSLGIVMYELLSGHVPFTGETPSHVMVSLMEEKLPPLKDHAIVPDELDRFVKKALRKNQKERYQTAGQLARELKEFKQNLQRDSQSSQWLKIVPSSKEGAELLPLAPSATVTGAHPIRVEHGAATETAAIESNPTSSAEYLVREIKTHRTLAIAALVIIVSGVIGLTYLYKKRIGSSRSQTKATVLSAAANPTPKRGTTNDEAYRYYMQGRNLINQRNPAEVRRAAENFQEAIRLDPNFAQPYAGLGNAYVSLGDTPKAKEAIQKALELDNNLAEAYAVRGFVSLTYDWDFTSAEKDVRRALELEPENDWAHWVQSMVLAETGRFDEALKAIETAQGLAPGTAVYERDRGRILYYGRRYDEAILQLKRAIELKRDFHSAWSWIVRAHEMKGDQAGAFNWFIEWREFKKFEGTEEYRLAYEAEGWMGVKRKFLAFVKSGKDYPDMDKYEIAGNLAQLGETDEAFLYLNKSVDKREWEIVMLNIDPYLDGLRGDPRFNDLVKRANFR